MTDTVVLDASAVLAVLFDEPGAGEIAVRLDGALLSAVNYHEVVAKLVDRNSPTEEIIAMIGELDVVVVPVDRAQAEAAGLLRASTRAIGLSLGDRSCLALALSRGAVAVTTDRVWGSLDIGVAVEVIR